MIKRKMYWVLSFACLATVTRFGDAMEKPSVAAPQSQANSGDSGFRGADLNGDGAITADEFATATHLSSSAPTSPSDIRATRIMGAFHAMDKNQDGKVSDKEYEKYLKDIGS